MSNQILKIPGNKERKREAKEKIMQNNEKIRKQCDMMLMSLIGKKEFVEQWWKSQNKSFGMLTANEMFDIDPEYVKSYLMSHSQGEYS